MMYDVRAYTLSIYASFDFSTMCVIMCDIYNIHRHSEKNEIFGLKAEKKLMGLIHITFLFLIHRLIRFLPKGTFLYHVTSITLTYFHEYTGKIHWLNGWMIL